MLLLFGAFMMNAQNIPSTLNYQAVVRNNQNQVIPSQSVKFKFSVIDNGGISVCSEEVSLNTSAIGLVDHKIGTINTTGFANINWKSAKKIKVEIDINNGTNYVNMGDIDLQSVPFANVAKDLEVSGTTIGQVLKWNGSKWVPDTDNVGNGIPGPQGPAGPTGAQGPIGLTGPAGAMGAQGPIGLTGARGPIGAQGPIGLTGPTGAMGAQGPIGLTGAMGPIGPQGPIGLTGADGPMGPHGPIGLTGPTGAMGAQGPIGLTGAMGPIGPQGPAGNYIQGNGIIISNDTIKAVDISPTNELQNLTFNAITNTLYLSGSNNSSAQLPFQTYSGQTGISITPQGGINPNAYNITNTMPSKWTQIGNDIYNNSGNVSIGSNLISNAIKLKVVGSNSPSTVGVESVSGGTGIYGSGTQSGGVGVYGYSGTSAGVNGKAIFGYSENGTAGYFYTTSGKALITQGGNVGINNLNPSTDLDVNGEIRATDNCYFMNKVGIGTVTPTQALEISGAIKMNNSSIGPVAGCINLDNNNFLVGGHLMPNRMITNGNSIFPLYDLGSTSLRWKDVYCQSVNNSSDRRLKQDIEVLNYGLKEVMKLKPVTYKWISNPKKGKVIGFIAQDLQEVVNEVVQDKDWSQNEKGEWESKPSQLLGVAYSELIPVLTKAIQEQQQIIDAQKKLIEANSNELNELKNQVASIKEAIQLTAKK